MALSNFVPKFNDVITHTHTHTHISDLLWKFITLAPTVFHNPVSKHQTNKQTNKQTNNEETHKHTRPKTTPHWRLSLCTGNRQRLLNADTPQLTLHKQSDLSTATIHISRVTDTQRRPVANILRLAVEAQSRGSIVGVKIEDFPFQKVLKFLS